MKAALENNSPLNDLRKPVAEMCMHRAMETRTETPLHQQDTRHRKRTTPSLHVSKMVMCPDQPVVEGIFILDRKALVVYGEQLQREKVSRPARRSSAASERRASRRASNMRDKTQKSATARTCARSSGRSARYRTTGSSGTRFSGVSPSTEEPATGCGGWLRARTETSGRRHQSSSVRLQSPTSISPNQPYPHLLLRSPRVA
jgi:hypothetical protein